MSLYHFVFSKSKRQKTSKIVKSPLNVTGTTTISRFSDGQKIVTGLPPLKMTISGEKICCHYNGVSVVVKHRHRYIKPSGGQIVRNSSYSPA